MTFAFALALLASAGGSYPAPDLGDLTVDPSRLPAINAHDRIPVDTSAWKVQDFSGPKTGTAVQAAIEAAAPETILVLPHGTYSGELTHRASSVVVRGDCADRSAVVWAHDGNPKNGLGDWKHKIGFCTGGWLQMCGPNEGDTKSDVFQSPRAWTAGFERGTSELTVADASDLSVGELLLLESSNAGDPRERLHYTSLTYIAAVSATGHNKISLDRTLPIDFSSADATVTRLGRMQRHAGVECLTLNHTNPSDPAGVYKNVALTIALSTDSWVWNVDLGDTYNTFAGVSKSSQVVIERTRFGDQLKSKAGDGNTCDDSGSMTRNPCWNKQALTFSEAHDNSFISNVVESSIGLEFDNGCSRNWVAFNHFPKPNMHPVNEPRRAIFPHGKYGHDNLIEGNTIYGALEMDTVWGSQGPRITFFRNVALDNLPTSPLGISLQFSTEAWADAPDPFLLGRNATYLLNYGRQYTGSAGKNPIDTRSLGMWFERNVYTDRLLTGDKTAIDTVLRHNYDASKAPLGHAWDGLRLPSSLNRRLGGKPPAFWCTNTRSAGGAVCDFEVMNRSVGAWWDASCVLPAQQLHEGGECAAGGA